MTRAITTAAVATAWSLSVLVWSIAASANPTGEQPDRPLAAHGTISEAKDLVASLYQLYGEEEKFVIQAFAKMDNPASLSDGQISKAAGRLWKARRDADHLKLMGEPAADDLYKKLFLLAVEVDKIAAAYSTTPRGGQLLQRYAQQLNREKPALDKFLQQADNAIGQGKLEAVATQLDSRGVQLYEKLVYFSPTARMPYFTLFSQVLGKNDGLLSSKRRADYQRRASEAVAKNLAAATAFPAEVERVCGELVASGRARLAGDQSGGPAEAFAHVAGLWGNASAGLTRATAIAWAMTNSTSSQVEPTPQAFKDIAVRGLASVIEAAAASTPPDQVAAVYGQLLQQISALDRRCGPWSKDVHAGCTSALAKLAALDPALATRIGAYERATSEPLRWRKLYASQQAKLLSDKFPAAVSLLDTKAPASEGIRPDFVRMGAAEMITAPHVFGEAANWMVQEASRRLVGKPVAAEQVVRLSPTSRTAVIPFVSRYYGNAPVSLNVESELAELRDCLLLDEAHGPLSIEAADAISAGELHDYVSMAGLVQTVHLESAVTRLATIPDTAYVLTSLGKTPMLDTTIEPRQQTCWRLDVQPMWAHHLYFTARAASGGDSSAGQ